MLGAFLVRSGRADQRARLRRRSDARRAAADPSWRYPPGAAFALFAWRAPALASGGVFAPASRESLIVLNNILLTAATATVLLGTLFPLIREAIGGDDRSRSGRPIST
jgi:cytochrome c-type biogenesis protein CcmF